MKFWRALFSALALMILLAHGVAAQTNLPVFQSGLVTPGHVPIIVTNGVIGDGGSADMGNVTELGITNTGTPFCINDALVSSLTGYHQLCLGANALGSGLLSFQAYGGASQLQFLCNINGVTTPCFGSVTGVPSVPSNAALLASPTTSPIMYRAGFYAAGDGGGAYYNLSGSPCSLNSGAGDQGIEVEASNGGCWNAADQGRPIDARVWGAPDDGATDAGAIINTACKDYNAVLIPVSTSGFYINTPVVCPAGHLQGVLANAINPYPATGFPGQSWFLCSATVNPCVTIGDISDNNITNPIQVSNLMIVGVTTPPSSGIVGLKITQNYRASFSNVHVYNFDTCIYIKGNGNSGVDLTLDNVTADRCQTHWWVFDQWNVITIAGGQDGTDANNTGFIEYTNSADVYEFTATSGGSGYQGPNTITMTGKSYVNSTGGAACLFNWANFSSGYETAVAGAGIKIADNHFEQHAFSGTAKGTFCSDGTLSPIGTVFIHDNSFNMGSNAFGFFDFNPLSAMSEWRVHDNVLGGCGNVNLAPSPASGAGFQNDIVFSHNLGCISASFTAPSTGPNHLYMSGNDWGALTVAGPWAALSSLGDIYGATSLTDTATGAVTWENPGFQTWTPILMCGATACTALGSPWAYTVNAASVQRRGPGFVAVFNITITTKGTASGANVSLQGLPYECSNSFGSGGATPLVLSNITTNTVVSPTVVLGAPIGGISPIILENFNSTAGNYGQITDAAVTGTTGISGSVTCLRTN